MIMTGKTGIIVLCFFLVIVSLIIFYGYGMSVKEGYDGLYVSVSETTTSNLDKAVNNGNLVTLNNIPNTGAPIIFSDTPPVVKNAGPDPEFPIEGSIIQCSVDDINGNGSYYMVSNTNPKTINLFPNDDRSIINSWSDTWASAPSFKNCSAFNRGPTMESKIPLPAVGVNLHCKNEDSLPNRHVYRVMTTTKIKPFPGQKDDPDQIVAKSWGVNPDNQVDVDDCSHIYRYVDKNGERMFKYKPDMKALEGKLVKCLQTKFGDIQPSQNPGGHGKDAIYKVENGKLRWFQNVTNAYTSLENLASWGLTNTPVTNVPDCDSIAIGDNIHFNGKKLPKGSYTKCAIDVPGGAGVGQIYRVVGDNGELSWTVSSEIASFFDPNFNKNNPTYNSYYPDCSSFRRASDITKYGPIYYRDYTEKGTYNLSIPPGCIGIRAITVGGGGGGGGGAGGWRWRGSDGAGGGPGGGGAGAVVFFNGNYSVPIDDNNRNSNLKIYVGSGGEGGIRAGHNRGPVNTSGNDGESSYIALVENNNETRYFEAGGGKGGEKGGFANDYRGKPGNGGAGGTVIVPDKYAGYAGNNGMTRPNPNNEPWTDADGGDGGTVVNIPAEVPENRSYGIGGHGGLSSASWVDHATNGYRGNDGFVRVQFIF